MRLPRNILAVLVAVFAFIVFQHDLLLWFRFAAGSSLYSYTLVVPPLCMMLMARGERMSVWLVVIVSVSVIAFFVPETNDPSPPGYLRLAIFILLGQIAALIYTGWLRSRQQVLPRLLFFAAIPLPPVLESAFNGILQSGSAALAFVMFRVLGVPVFRDELNIALPGLTMEVAASCSGIRSTLVLMLVAIVAGYLFLKSPWHRALLLAAIIPLGMLRNALRITTIGWLTIHVDPGVISGPLHKHGGPLFFAITLFPLLAWILVMRQPKGISR